MEKPVVGASGVWITRLARATVVGHVAVAVGLFQGQSVTIGISLATYGGIKVIDQQAVAGKEFVKAHLLTVFDKPDFGAASSLVFA